MSQPHRRFVFACVIVCALARAGPGQIYQTIDMTSIANEHYQDWYGGAQDLPEGNVSLGGVPFHIAPEGLNSWYGVSVADSGIVSVDIPVNEYGVTDVHTLINTTWGQPNNSYAKIEFFGQNGSYYEKKLYGNDDIRDWLQYVWTNTINGTTTNMLWEGVTTSYLPGTQCRIDKQAILLPHEFATDTLTTMRLTDSGGYEFQRAFLSGVTVAVAPDPTTLVVLMLGGLVVARAVRWGDPMLPGGRN